MTDTTPLQDAKLHITAHVPNVDFDELAAKLIPDQAVAKVSFRGRNIGPGHWHDLVKKLFPEGHLPEGWEKINDRAALEEAVFQHVEATLTPEENQLFSQSVWFEVIPAQQPLPKASSPLRSGEGSGEGS